MGEFQLPLRLSSAYFIDIASHHIPNKSTTTTSRPRQKLSDLLRSSPTRKNDDDYSDDIGRGARKKQRLFAQIFSSFLRKKKRKKNSSVFPANDGVKDSVSIDSDDLFEIFTLSPAKKIGSGGDGDDEASSAVRRSNSYDESSSEGAALSPLPVFNEVLSIEKHGSTEIGSAPPVLTHNEISEIEEEGHHSALSTSNLRISPGINKELQFVRMPYQLLRLGEMHLKAMKITLPAMNRKAREMNFVVKKMVMSWVDERGRGKKGEEIWTKKILMGQRCRPLEYPSHSD